MLTNIARALPNNLGADKRETDVIDKLIVIGDLALRVVMMSLRSVIHRGHRKSRRLETVRLAGSIGLRHSVTCKLARNLHLSEAARLHDTCLYRHFGREWAARRCILSRPKKNRPSGVESRHQRRERLDASYAIWRSQQEKAERERLASAREQVVADAAAVLPRAANSQVAAEPFTDWTPALSGLADFFRDAGISVAARADRRLYLGNVAAGKLPRLEEGTSAGSSAWRDAVDKIVWVYARDVLDRALRRYCPLDVDLVAAPAPGRNGFALVTAGRELAVIRATHAVGPGREMIPGNFLIAGEHWDRVGQALHGAETGTSAQPAASDAWTVTSPRRFDILPGSISPELRKACIEASRRIRLERRTAFGRRIVLEGGGCELMVEPIGKRKDRLHVPFAFSNDKDSEGAPVQGELALIGTDPLPVLITSCVSDSAAYTAWAYMLLGFAELTCNSPEPVLQESRTEHPRFLPRDYLRSGHRRTGGESTRTQRPWSGSLEPTGHWYTAGGTYVAAHISRLPFGREHSPDAAQLAQRVGISLEQQETWVRDYIRGVPKDAEIRFRWRTPAELAASNDSS